MTGRKKNISGYLCEEIEMKDQRKGSKFYYWVTRTLPNHEFLESLSPILGMVMEIETQVEDNDGRRKGSVTVQYEVKSVVQPEAFIAAIREVNKMINFKQEQKKLLRGDEKIDTKILIAVNAIPDLGNYKKLVLDEELVPFNKTGIKTKATFFNNNKQGWVKMNEEGTMKLEIDFRYTPPDTSFIRIDTSDLSKSVNGPYIYKYYQDTLCRVHRKNPILDRCWKLIAEEKVRKKMDRQDNKFIPKVDYYYNENLLLNRAFYHESGGEILYKYNQKGQMTSKLELPRNRTTTLEYYANGLRSKECTEKRCYTMEYDLVTNNDGSFTFTMITIGPDEKETKLIQQYDNRHNLIHETEIDIKGKKSEIRIEIEYY